MWDTETTKKRESPPKEQTMWVWQTMVVLVLGVSTTAFKLGYEAGAFVCVATALLVTATAFPKKSN